MTKGIDASDESSYLAPPSKEKPLVPIPVAGGSSGEGFPYAPVGWPCPGDVWRWKVGNRKTPSGYWIDRHLYPPIRYQKATGNKIKFSSRVSIREYIQKEYPDADINAFFSSFIWKIPCAGLIPRKDANNYNFSYTFLRSSDVNGHSASESKTKVGDCKIGNKMCSLQVKARSYVLAAKDCDICCSEADFCRDCCCILCCRTIGWEYGGYSFIRCEATVDENYICGHVAHVDCALRAYMAGTVGGTIDLDVEYCCRRCDNKTDLIPHVSKLIRNCESLDAPNDILKILDLCLCILHGSNQMRASNLRKHIGCVMDKLKHGVRLDEIWEVEDNISTLTTGDTSHRRNEVPLLGELHIATSKIISNSTNEVESSLGIDERSQRSVYITSGHSDVSTKLEDEVDRVLKELKKSQELEYRIAEQKLYTHKDVLLGLYRNLDAERSELASPTTSIIAGSGSDSYDALLANVLNRVDRIKHEEVKLRHMMKIGKGFGQTPRDVLTQHFGLPNDVE